MPFISTAQRRARLVTRHAIHPDFRVSDAKTATRAVGVLHATEPATVYLSIASRMDHPTVADIDELLYADKAVVKQLAMRRTLFGFPQELLPAALGGPSAIIAQRLERGLVKEVEAGGLATDGAAWLESARAAVLELMADGSGWQAAALRTAIPMIDQKIEVNPDKPYGGSFPIAPRVLTWLGARGELARGDNAGHWRVSRPQWMTMESWLGGTPEPMPSQAAFAALTTAYLRAFGPATLADIVWWFGMGVGVIKKALAAINAVEVDLEQGTGWVLPDDVEAVSEPTTAAILLPVLDPTVMGWKEREFYLGDLAGQLFDRNGNVGTTAWWDGEIVGCWVQDPDGAVQIKLVREVPAAGRAALAAEAARLGSWLAGEVVGTVYPSPAMKQARAEK